MTIVRRAAGLGTLLLSILGLLLCTAGIVSMWAGKSRLDAVAAAVFGTADEALSFVAIKLDHVKRALDKGQQRFRGVSRIAERLKNAQADVSKECEPLLQTLDAVFDELKSAESWLDSSHAVAQGVSRVSEAVVSSGFAASRPESAGVAVAGKVQAFSEEVADALAKLQAMRRELVELRDKRKLARDVAVGIVARVADMEGRLSRLSARIGELDAQVEATRAASAELGERFHWWTTVAAIAITLVLLWFGVSQAAMMRSGWRLARPAAPPGQL